MSAEPRRVSDGRVLVIAGSDSGGGAGIQADIKTITALNGYAMTAVTAITVQNTLGVSAVHPIPGEIVRAQIDAVMGDIGADAWKIGMLGGADLVELVYQAFYDVGEGVPIVLDPVMIAKGGASLLEDKAVDLLRDKLMPIAAIVTPNAPEAERLTGVAVFDLDTQKRAAEKLLEQGAWSALVKGGHIEGPIVYDVFATQAGMSVFEQPRIETRATHGTGCTLASAIAAGVARGMPMRDAIARAREYLMGAMLAAPGYGEGHQPLGHAWTVSEPRKKS
ncbi:MAG: bifunctional hydroxymethylpyrimidine kinase/phosphomethylpyrimidine kinase [Hyphomonadaceae bacterium]